jgi:Fe-S-cluster containining protein
MVVENPEAYDEGCFQCGLCCKVFGDRITPTVMNLYTWMESKRTDILKFFSVCIGKGRYASASDISPEDLSDILSIELRDPETGEYLPCCPFLRRASKNRYFCSIHTTKPDMCCNYMPWAWGETYFPQCKSLKDTGKRLYLTKIQAEDEPAVFDLNSGSPDPPIRF